MRATAVDNYYGTEVADPFRWLEDDLSTEVQAWTKMQNACTRAVLDAIPGYGDLLDRFRQILDLGTITAPTERVTVAGVERLFHYRRRGLQNHGVFCVRSGVAGPDRELIDVSELASDGTAALAFTSVSPRGSYVAWGRSDSGTEDCVLYIREVDTGIDLSDAISRTRLASIAWTPDESGFYYTRYPDPATTAPGDEHYFRSVFFHLLGTNPDSDPRVFPEDGTDGHLKTDSPSVSLSPNGRWLVVRVHRGAHRSEIWFRDLWEEQNRGWTVIGADRTVQYRPIPRDGLLYLLTNDGARRSRLVSVNYGAGGTSWQEVITENDDVLRSVYIGSEVIVASYLHMASTRLSRYRLDGTPLGPVPLPSIGTATVRGRPDGKHVFVHFSSFVTPGEVTRFDLDTGVGQVWDRISDKRLDIADVTVTMATASSRDGTQVPMFVVARGEVPRNGSAASILTGYGGFSQCASPEFSARALSAVEHGVVWVAAILRGGGEFGDSWHRNGMLADKQNVFDDFIACAQELIDSGITSARRLGIVGSSNGGLLTAAAVTQCPKLFRAAISDVPVTDMLRYHQFSGARLWASEFGTAEDPEQFRFLYAYSPYHRVREGTQYPAMLFVTAENDTRVAPLHARKMAARMQQAQRDNRESPILLRVESHAGHGAGKPTWKLVDEYTDQMAFLFGALVCPLTREERG